MFKDNMTAFIVVNNGMKRKKKCASAREVYDFLTQCGIYHDTASDAYRWSEQAEADETYNEKQFDIYMER